MFRANNLIPATAYPRSKSSAAQVKGIADSNIAKYTTTGANGNEIFAMTDNLRGLKADLNTAKNVPGIVQYAKDQEDDQTYDVAQAFTDVLQAINAVLAEVEATFPTSAGGWLELNKMESGDASLTPRDFTTGQLASLTATLQTLSDAIV